MTLPLFEQYLNKEDQAINLAHHVAAGLKTSLEKQGKATLCVPGGTTPLLFLSALSKQELDWNNVHVLLNDERWVAPSHPRSNFAMLKENLFQNQARAAQFLPFYQKGKTVQEGIFAVEEAVQKILPIDVLVLGMGEDMHTASLFPQGDRLQEALSEDSAHMILPMRAPGAAEPRITLTLPALLSATHSYILITGQSKKEAIEKASKISNPLEAPISAILQKGQPKIFYTP